MIVIEIYKTALALIVGYSPFQIERERKGGGLEDRGIELIGEGCGGG